MKGKKINFKLLIYIICILLSIFIIFLNYENYLEKKEKEKLLIESIKDIEEKIERMEIDKKIKLGEIKEKEEKINILLQKLDMINVGNEGEFKRIIYVFSKESGLKLKEISKSEKVWERGGYSLKYIYFTLYGNLNDFGKFMYLVNKSKKYIDTRKTYIELKPDEFKISLGFIEKVGEEKMRILIVICIIFINLNIFSNKVDNYISKKDIKEYKNIFLFRLPKEKNKKEEIIKSEKKENKKEKNKKEQIVIKAIIIDTSSNLFEKIGLNWALLNGEVSLGKILEGGNDYLGVDFNFLRENGDIKIEAMPTLVITEGELGELRVTEEVIVGEKKTSRNNNEYSEPVFSEAGIVFKIIGEIQENKKILLRIDTEISNFKLTSSYSEKAGAKQKNQTKTVVELEDGKSVFIGGLKQNVDKGTNRKVPVLSNIPILGELFKLKKSSRENRDIYIEIEASIK